MGDQKGAAANCPVCSGAIKKHLITPIFGHEEDDDNDDESKESKEDESIPSRPAGNREPPPRRFNNIEFQFFTGFDIFRYVMELMTADNALQYRSEQHRMDELISKCILGSLICIIFGILLGVI